MVLSALAGLSLRARGQEFPLAKYECGPCRLLSSQGPEEMCLSLEHQNPSKTSEQMCYFDHITEFCYTSCRPQTKRLRSRKIGLQYKIQIKVLFFTRNFVPRSPFARRPALVTLWVTCHAPQPGYGLRLLIFKMAYNKVDLSQIRSKEIVYSGFIKIP